MRAAFALSVAALAGNVLASPVVEVVYKTALHTVYVTQESYAVPTAAPVYEPAQFEQAQYEQAPAPTTSSKRRTRTQPHKVYTTVTPIAYNPAPTTEMVYQTFTPVAPQAPAPTNAVPAAPVDTGYMGIVNVWRGKLGMKTLAHDDALEANALDCVKSSAGEMKHKLNTGSMGQVLAPGKLDDFEHVFLGGWLCEMPSLPGLNGICSTASDGWAYAGQTDHAKILTSPSYSKIGCALFDGIWGCDLA